ncbi:MAG: glycoside hydrolase family 127 protein [Defluviitaleaceae bacterium]|nr:glycoside hydrolase family 127 protein [Defluviitaleaceae bacterium]
MTNIDMIRKDLDDIYLGNLFTVEADLTLPSQGKNGSEFTWKSSFIYIITPEGKVTRPRTGSGNRTVTLTATATKDGEEMSRDFEATVLERPSRLVITGVNPVVASIGKGEDYHLPGVVIVAKEGGVFGTLPVTWKDVPDFTALDIGVYSIQAEPLVHVPDFVPTAEITVLTEAPKVPVALYTQKAWPFGLGDVKLLPGHFDDNRKRFEEYLLNCDDDQMLYNFRVACGLSTKGAEPMTGWDSPEGLLRGHTTGHYLSGIGLACGGSVENGNAFKKKVDYMVESLAECQDAFEASGNYAPGFLSAYSEEQFDKLEEYVVYPKIWAPYYTLHKIFAGLLDCYEFGQSKKALKIAERLGIWVYARLSRLPKEQLNKMWAMYIAGEYGGMNEAMARLYKFSPNPDFLAAARLFDNEKLFLPLSQNINALCDMHGNQHVPQIIGAFEIFRQTGEGSSYEISHNFWHFVTQSHIYNLGGIGEGEMFKEPDHIASYLTDKTAESCVSYNMLKLSSQLFQYNAKSEYMDYYERTLFNHIAGNGDPSGPTGGSTYFMPLYPGAKKGYDTNANSCCHGTGLESHVKYQDSIYFKQENILYVNLYMPSALDWKEKGIKLTQARDFMKTQSALFEIDGNADIELRFRIPFWLEKDASLKLNGADVSYEIKDGYAVVPGPFSCGDKLEIVLPFSYRLERTKDDTKVACLYYGPLALVIESEGQEFITLDLDESVKGIEKKGDLEFAFSGHRLIPLFLAHDCHYHAYFKLKK